MVMSRMILSSSRLEVSTSSRWVVRYVYRSLTRAYSSMAPRFGVPSPAILRFSSAILRLPAPTDSSSARSDAAVVGVRP